MLEGRTLYVAGGAGEVGEGIVAALLARGARVAVSSRSAERLEALAARVGGEDRLVPVVGALDDDASAARLRDQVIARAGALDGVVASLGGWWQGAPVTAVPLELWRRLIDDSLTAHYLAARHFLPAIADREGASYTLVNGAGGLGPVRGAGPISVSAAAQLMLKDVLAAEHRDRAVRVNALVLATPVLTRSRPTGRPEWLTAEDAGAYAAQLASPASRTRGETIVFSDRAQLAPAHATP